jgi:hypothetical protein
VSEQPRNLFNADLRPAIPPSTWLLLLLPCHCEQCAPPLNTRQCASIAKCTTSLAYVRTYSSSSSHVRASIGFSSAIGWTDGRRWVRAVRTCGELHRRARVMADTMIRRLKILRRGSVLLTRLLLLCIHYAYAAGRRGRRIREAGWRKIKDLSAGVEAAARDERTTNCLTSTNLWQCRLHCVVGAGVSGSARRRRSPVAFRFSSLPLGIGCRSIHAGSQPCLVNGSGVLRHVPAGNGFKLLSSF